MTEGSTLGDAERARLEQRRDRIMKLLREGDGAPGHEALDSEDRDDLMREWKRLDDQLNRR